MDNVTLTVLRKGNILHIHRILGYISIRNIFCNRPHIIKIRRILGYEIIRNILYNRPLKCSATV